jgi:hypothetical protein
VLTPTGLGTVVQEGKQLVKVNGRGGAGTLRAALVLLAGLAVVWLLAWRMARPLGALTREVEAIRRLNFDEPAPRYKLLGLAMVECLGDASLRVDPALAARLPAWKAVVRHYRAGAFAAAVEALAEAGAPAQDPVLALYAERIATLREARVDADWSPVLRFTTKWT